MSFHSRLAAAMLADGQELPEWFIRSAATATDPLPRRPADMVAQAQAAEGLAHYVAEARGEHKEDDDGV